MFYFSWVLDHWEGIAGIMAALHGFAVAIVNLTDTPVEGTFQHHMYRHVERAAGLITDRAKQTGAPDEAR